MSDPTPLPAPEPPEEPRPLEPAGAPPAAEQPFWNYVDVLLLTALAIPLLVGATIAVTLLFRVLNFKPQAKALGPIAVMFLFYGLWFLALFELIRVRYLRPFWRSLAWLRPPKPAGTYVLWGVFTAAAAIALLIVLHPPQAKTQLDELLNNRLSLILLCVFAITLGPLCEELAFRGFLLPLLVRSYGSRWGVLLQAVPFALLHGPEYSWSWQRLIPIYMAGVSFGWVRYSSGSTAAAAYAHGGYNLVVFVLGVMTQK
jgi:membrane protease YdiL (CAAX protease family)